MFADIVGFTALSEQVGTERAYFAVTGALRILDGIARRHGGSVDKYLGDSLMVVFGHPVPHPEPAHAASRAALEMRERLEEYARGLGVRLDLSIGINTGATVAGDVRGRVIREFHLLGDAVNVAARLKAKARRGAIYLGLETRAETTDDFEHRALGSVKLKGKAVDVPIFELVGSRERSSGHGLGPARNEATPLLGRERELGRIEAALERVAAGRGGALALVGDEGLGKSRLLAEAGKLAAAQKIGAFHASAAGGARERPLELLARILEALGEEEARGEAAALRGGSVRGEAAAALVAARLLRRAADEPFALALDDLERADRGSLELLPGLLEGVRGAGVLLLLACRPDADLALPGRVLAGGAAEEIRLEPLAPSECRALVEGVAAEPLSEESLALLLARGAGNPARLLLGSFLEPALRAEREHRRHDERSSDAERRRATILFADISGFTAMTERLGAERAYPVVVGCLQLLDDVARRHGGTVEKYLGDCVMALFGVPEAIEDAPRAAVNAAIEMRRSVRAYSDRLGGEVHLDVHSGVHTGLGIAGDVSAQLLREFAVMGEPVSVADALKDHAPPGAIYVGEEAFRATREVFEYREVASAELEEQTGVRRAFELLSTQERLHRARIGAERRIFSSLVGREGELAALRGCLARLRAGQGGIASVVAEAGLGKSRLVAELAASEEAKELSWREGRSISTGQHMSLHPFADLCRSWAGIGDEDDDASARAKLRASVARVAPDEVDEIAPFVARILGLPPDEVAAERLAGLHGDALEKLIRGSVTRLLRAGSALRPQVVVMDDLHWADLSSIELLEALLRLCEEHPILFLLLSRPGSPKTSGHVRERARSEHGARYTEIELRPLDGSSARSLLNNLFRQGDIPHAARQLIEEKAQGNPFYIEEVVRSLVDEGAVEYRDGRFCATEKIHSVVIPGTIQEVIMARLDGLPLRKRQILQTACVIGAAFHRDVLAAIAGEEERLAGELEDLLDAEFLVPSDRLPGEEYGFKHPLIQEVAYDGLLQARREELHRKVGEAIERVLPAELPGRAGMLAYHFSKGQDAERAEEFLFRAGDEAARAAASSEALHFFEEASKLYLEAHGGGGDPEKRALLEKSVARALYFRGRFVEAIEHFDRALECLGDRVVEGRVRSAALFVANLGRVLARLYGPRVGRRRAALPHEREIFELRYARAEATVTALPTRHLFDSMDGLALLQRIDPASVPRAGMFYAGAAALFAFGGISFDVSRRLAARAHSLVSDDPDEYLYERAMGFTGRVLEGDWSDEHEIEPGLLAESVRRGQLWGPTTYLGLLAEKRMHRGDFAGAEECMAQIDEIWDLFDYDLAKTNHYYLRALLPLERHDAAAARQAADAYYDENPEDLLHILALGARAKAETLLGELEAAEATLARAAEIVARSSPVPPFHASCYQRSRLLHDVATLAGARDGRLRRLAGARARRSARAALRGAARVAWRRTEVLRLAGLLRAQLGDRAGALRWLERSVAAGEALGARPEIARTYAEVGRLLRATGAPQARFRGVDAEECLRRARDDFEALDLPFDRDRLDRAPASSVAV